MEFMEITDNKGNLHYINPSHISAMCEIEGKCKLNLMGQDYMFTKETMEEVKVHLISFRH